MTEHQPYDTHEGQHGVKISYILKDQDRCVAASVGLMGWWAYKKRCARKKDFRLKKGLGAGNEALVRWNALTSDEQSVLIAAFGSPDAAYHPLDKYFEMDGEARAFYDNYRFDSDRQFLNEEQKKRYTLRASVLNALLLQKNARFTDHKKKGGSTRGVWVTLRRDVKYYEERCIQRYGYGHGLPSSDKLRQKLNEYTHNGTLNYACLIDGRAKNQNAQAATPEMIELWMAIYAGQKGYKPNHIEVARTYQNFLVGKTTIVNNETGELYSCYEECYRPVTARTILRYQSQWQNKIGSHLKRTGNIQQYKGIYIPPKSRKAPAYAGTIISVDDRQSSFEYGVGKRMWYYLGIDVGSQAITAWTWGDSKEGIILDFYKQMVANYHSWNTPLPYELEGEMSLNSSFINTFLANGAMFQRVRIEANNARGKIIERFFREIRYRYEKKIEGHRPRPFAKDEANQISGEKKIYLTKQEIITIGMQIIKAWNDELHPNQKLHPGMSRWDVFTEKQHPELENFPTNYAGILPHLGSETKTSMKAGRVLLQNELRWAAEDGQLLSGEKLVQVLRQIEGKEFTVRWLDKGMYGKGEVIKAFVYKDGKQVCELIGNEAQFAHGTLERTEQDKINYKLQDAYQKTVESYAKTIARGIDRVTVTETKERKTGGFVMPGLEIYEPPTEAAETLPPAKRATAQQHVPVISTIEDDY